MCSIIGSYHKDKIVELIKLNAYRGQHSWSISYYSTIWNGINNVIRGMGEIPYELINIGIDEYCIVHMQAPTTSNKEMNTVHPAQIGYSLLWHNGIIKDKHIKKMQEELHTDESWDTKLILKQYIDKNTLMGIDGTFACLMHHEEHLYLFRNMISPLFYDKYGNISSTRFDDALSIDANVLFRFEPGHSLTPVDKFDTVNNPYYGLDL